jgi:2-polyprenyl-6-methoxyphenol hydroxylase-like FAD-dependent oxidoreductase
LRAKKLFYQNRLDKFSIRDHDIICTIKDMITEEYWSLYADFIVAADGGKSTVRKQLHIHFPGETTKELAFSFDAKLCKSLSPNTMYMFSGDNGRIVLVPIDQEGLYKMSGRWPDCATVSQEEDPKETNDLLSKVVLERSGVYIQNDTIRCVVKYRTHSKIADCFSWENKVFLMGDAAHVFFPAGGYGLNIAVDDARYLGEAFFDFFNHQDATKLTCYEEHRKATAERVKKESEKQRQTTMNTQKQADSIEKQVYAP